MPFLGWYEQGPALSTVGNKEPMSLRCEESPPMPAPTAAALAMTPGHNFVGEYLTYRTC
jgi:hypothetical protein